MRVVIAVAEDEQFHTTDLQCCSAEAAVNELSGMGYDTILAAVRPADQTILVVVKSLERGKAHTPNIAVVPVTVGTDESMSAQILEGAEAHRRRKGIGSN